MRPATVFFSYARSDDERVRKPLLDHLRALEQQGMLELVVDTGLQAGTHAHQELGRAILEGDATVALVSKEYLKSQFIAEVEIPLLEERKRSYPEYRIFPLILNKCTWRNIELFDGVTICPNGPETFSELTDNEVDLQLFSFIEHLQEYLKACRHETRQSRRARPSPPLDEPIFGRDSERAACAAKLEDFPILILCGAPGQGKTELGRYAAAGIADRFPDGIFEIDVQNETQAHSIPPLIADRLGLRPDQDVFNAIAHSKLLLLLDGFERLVTDEPAQEEETEGFLKPLVQSLRISGSRAIITSQVEFHRTGVQSRAVPPLDSAASVALFNRASDGEYNVHSEEEIGRFLTSDLGGHPYSIIILGRYSKGIGLDFDALKRRWRKTWVQVATFRASIDQRELATAFELTCSSLGPEAQTLLAAMGGLPDGLQRSEIDKIWSFAAAHLDQSLRTLLQRGLFDERARKTEQVFRLLGPIFRFAGYKLDMLPPEAKAEVTPYLAALDKFYDEFVRTFAPQESDPAPDQKNKLTRRHFHNIHASLDRRLVPMRDEAALAAGETVLQLYWAYHNNMVGARDAISSSDDAINYLRKAKDVFGANARPKEVVRCLHYTGVILWLRGEIPRARTYLTEALASPESTEAARLDCARAFAHIEYKEGSLLKAVELYQHTIAAAQAVGEAAAELRAEIGLMDAYRKLCEYSAAEAVFARLQERLTMAPHGVRGNAIRGLAYVALASGDLTRAERLYREALDFFRPVSPFGEAHCFRGLGDVHTAQEQWKAAEDEYTRALELYVEARKSPSLGVALVMLGQGRLALAHEEPEAALEKFEAAARLLDKTSLNEPYEHAIARELAGEAYRRMGQFPLALGQLEIAAAQFARMDALIARNRVTAKIQEVTKPNENSSPL